MDPISHPNYVTTGVDYDIALLKLAESVDLGVHTPACLPAATDDFTGGTTKASIYGGCPNHSGAELILHGKYLPVWYWSVYSREYVNTLNSS
jgi:hypothetical protein